MILLLSTTATMKKVARLTTELLKDTLENLTCLVLEMFYVNVEYTGHRHH